MSAIDIQARHTMDLEQAQEAAESLSRDLAEKFNITYHWDGDVIHFRRQGVDGTIEVLESEIRVRARLGFMLAMLRAGIEAEIRRYLRDHFGCTI